MGVMCDTDDEETQRGQRPWLPPSRGAGRGRGLLAASQWSPSSTEEMRRTTLVDTVPVGYGRPRGDATTCPMDESMTSHPTVIEPGRAGRGGGGRVINISKFIIAATHCAKKTNEVSFFTNSGVTNAFGVLL